MKNENLKEECSAFLQAAALVRGMEIPGGE